MKSPFSLLFLLWLLPLTLAAGPGADQKRLRNYEDSLRKLDSALFRGKDEMKLAANKKFSDLLRKALNTEGAFDYPFDSLKTIARLTAPDESFRIFNWNIPRDDGTHSYSGFIIVNTEKVTASRNKNLRKDKYAIYELIDKSAEIRSPEMATLSPEKWFGALYYKIIKTNDKSKNYYTLLGWDGNTPQTWKKLIESLSFDHEGKPVFGEKAIFHQGKYSRKRVIFEFRAELVMTLHWEEDHKRIVFDHLAPEVAGAEGMYQYYSQTFSYDAFVWKKGKWIQIDDVDAKNNKSKNDDRYVPPQGDQGGNGTGPAPQNVRQRGKLYRLLHPRAAPPPLSGAG